MICVPICCTGANNKDGDLDFVCRIQDQVSLEVECDCTSLASALFAIDGDEEHAEQLQWCVCMLVIRGA